MTRKKSRPTHRENAAAVPSNEGGFYKMFWNSMDTNPGTNGPNSPSQGDVPVTSPPVIIISDSPEGSPCAYDENSSENLVVPLPIKEEIREDSVEISSSNSSTEANSKNQESHSGISEDYSSHQTCPPGNPLTSPSKNSSPSTSLHTNLLPQINPPPSLEHSTPVSSCENSSASRTSSDEPPTEVEETPPRTEDGCLSVMLGEDNQVCDQVTTEEHVEMFPDSSPRKTANSFEGAEGYFSNSDVISNQSHSILENSGDVPVPNKVNSRFSNTCEGISAETLAHSPVIPVESGVSISEFQSIRGISGGSDITYELPSNTENVQDILEETTMDVASEPQAPGVSQVNYDETSHDPPDDVIDPHFSTVDTGGNDEENFEDPSLDETGRTLSLLRSLLNAPEEDLEDLNEAFSQLPALIGQRNDSSDYNIQNEGGLVDPENVQESSLQSSTDVPNMEIDQNTTIQTNILPNDENFISQQNKSNGNGMLVDEEDDFPTYHNFLPKKIKLDTIGILRSVKVLKNSVRTLYKEYLKDDVILRTVCTPEPPNEGDDESADEVEETTSFPLISVYPICCVKMERLPDPFVKKSTVTMSDDTFKTWKRQIIRQRNEEKFRNLKVWRRGRTLLWRECELAGMDRATYVEQVAYVKKHKLNENSSSGSDSSGDESEDGALSHQSGSSEESYSDLENEDSEAERELSPISSPARQNTSEDQSITSPHISSETSAEIHLPDDEYVVERTSTNQSSAAKAPSALKITIRKASTSKSEDDKEKHADKEEDFSIPVKPTVHKPRKIATKRTFRRPIDPVSKASVPPKTTADNKKSKSTPVEDEDLYDQSLLGTRSYEVENFNLLEKWDIPFEEPTLFRSPRAASRLAQLKTKEAFAPALKRHAPPKATTTSTICTTTTTTTTMATDVTSNTVSKAVKDVVEMLCSKTVQAILFPESKSTESKKPTNIEACLASATDSTHIQTHANQVSSKSLLRNEETSSNLDESSEFSQSETNSTLDASSDFGGSTASLASEDFVSPKNKSPKKPRRRRPRFGPAWGKKKKVKSKASSEKPVENDSSETVEHTTEGIGKSPVHSTEKPVENSTLEGKSQEVGASVHSTQVPVVSEGPGQSPYESEDDAAHRMKEPVGQKDLSQTASQKKLPNDMMRTTETPSKEPKRDERRQEEVVLPRLTRSKQPIVELDPELLENFGTRKRKPKTDSVDDVSKDKDTKKQKQDVTKKSPQIKAYNIKPSLEISKEASSTTDEVSNDEMNTQVPEVSEGPGDVGLDHNNRQDKETKIETSNHSVRTLRSRSRGPGLHPTKSSTLAVHDTSDDNKRTDEHVQVEQNKPADTEVPLDLESPASPPPETVEPEPLVNSRITRSKRRSGPAYVAVKSTVVASNLPSVGEIVDSIAGQRLPTLDKLFDTSNLSPSSPATELITAFRVQTSNTDDTPLVDGKVPTSPYGELGQQPSVQCESAHGESTQPLEDTLLESTPELSTTPVGFYGIQAVPKPSADTSFSIAGQTSEPSNNLFGVDIPCIPPEKSQSVAGVDLATEGSEAANASGSLVHEKPANEIVERLEVLDTLHTILAVTSPKKVRQPVTTTSPLLPPPLSSNDLQVAPPMNLPITQPSVSNISKPPTVSSSGLPTFLTGSQDMNSILPGTFLNSFLTTTLDTNLTTYSTEINDSTTLADDPDGDLVIDEGEVPDVNFWENLTNADLDKNDNSADFSDDDNNTDLADKIDKIVKDQIHQDPVPVPSLCLDKTSPETASVLNRRDSIDERTGLPNNLIQRLRDPRIRSRLLSQLEEEEANGKTPQSAVAPLLNSLPVNSLASSKVGDTQAAKIGISDPRRNIDEVSYSSVSTVDSLCLSAQVPKVPQVVTHRIMGAQLETISSAMASHPTSLATINTPALATPLETSGTGGQLPGVTQGTPIEPMEKSYEPEEPPDPSKVDFLVPPSDDEEEEESIKRRSKKAKKEVDVELMYKSPLEDLQSEARPGYGERAPRRYGDNFTRRKSGDDRQSRRSRVDDPRALRDRSRDRRFEDRGRSRSRDRRFEDRGRSRSRDGRFEDRGRSHSRDGRFDACGRDRSRSRDRRAYYDRPPRDQSRDRRAYDPYTGREDPETTAHHMEMQVPYSQSPWPVSPAFNHHQAVMMPSPRWQPNYYPEPNVPLHPPIFMPEPPKIDFMETRLINLELLPKTTNLDITPIKKVYSYFDKDSIQVFRTPPPAYDLNDQPHTIKMLDPVSEEMVDFIQTPRPTSGLTKEIFRHVPPDLNLDDVVKFHFISPAYVMVQDNEEDSLSSSDEQEDDPEAKQELLLHHHKRESKPPEHRKRVSKPTLEHYQKRESKALDGHLHKQAGESLLEHHSKGEGKSISGHHMNQVCVPEIVPENNPLQNILQSLPLLQQFSMQKFLTPAIPPPPPPPEWNDVDLRMSREKSPVTTQPPSLPKEGSKNHSRSRSNSPRPTSHRSRRSPSPRRSRRSRSRSRSHSDMSISPSRSRSRSPSYSRSHRGSRRRRSRSRSSERSRSSRSRRSRSPKRHSTSISPPRRHRR